MSGAYATETPTVSAQYINRSFVRMLDAGREKEAAEESSAFIRTRVRQEAAVREVMPPTGITEDELDLDENTDQPKKIVFKEPNSAATFVPFHGTPPSRWFVGDRYAVFFGKTVSDEFTKTKAELMTYPYDIRKLLADNSVKDMADAEDRYWRALIQAVVALNPLQVTTPGAFTSAGFKQAMQSLLNRRLPIGKMLMTKSLFAEAIDLPATAIGNAIAEAHYRDGIENEEKLWGMPVVSTIKSDIYDPKEVWMFTPQNFLGVMLLLQDATLFIEQRADIIKFHTYAYPGIGLGNRLSVQKIEFT